MKLSPLETLKKWRLENPYEYAYQTQRNNAKRRGIDFNLTYEEWLSIWENSGHFNERGRKLGQYVMSRFNDIGDYSINNVEIIVMQKNQSDATKGKKKPPMSENQKKLLSSILRGRKITSPRSEEYRINLSNSRIGKTWTNEQKENMSANWHYKRNLT